MDKILKFFNPGTRRRKEQETIRKLIFESVRPTIKTIQHSVGPTIEPVRVQTVRREDLKRIGCCTLLPAIRWVHDSTNTLPVKGINRSMELVDRERCSHLSRLFNAASIFEMGGFWAYSLTAVASAATSPVFVSQFLMASLQLVMLLRSKSVGFVVIRGQVETSSIMRNRNHILAF